MFFCFDSGVKFYKFDYVLRDSKMKYLNLHDFQNFAVELYEFHDFHYSVD